VQNPQSSNTSARGSEADSPAPDASPWSPLQQAVFRALWIALIASNIGTWMQSVGAAWLMTSLTPSPLLVALMQTATSLPILLVGLPAGALADIVDRRKLLLVTETWMLLVALILGVLTMTGSMSAWALLGLTFLLGLGAAFDAPAWQAIVPEIVERQELPAAVALNATGFNVSRAVGPALGGLVVAAAGPAAVFLLNAVSFLTVLVVIYRWRRAPILNTAPAEEMLGATAAGMRYVRHSAALQAVLIRVVIFMSGASALWALLPVVTRYELGLDATGYGIILGSLGFGAVAATLIMPRLRRTWSIDQLTAVAALLFAGATLALAYLRFVPLIVVSMMAGGMAWLAMMSNLTVVAQTASPGWVRARALAIYLLAFQGMMALGSFAWGVLAEQLGNSSTLALAALTLLGGLVLARRWPLQTIESLDLTPSMHWRDPQLAINPDLQDGPVLITVEYQVPVERAGDFIKAMDSMHSFRRQGGAVRWGLFRDLVDPERYVETFIVPTWAEHMRQHTRVTVADQEIEARAFAFQKPGVEPVAAHLIAARPYDDRVAVVPPHAKLL
jgi:MFS family permease